MLAVLSPAKSLDYESPLPIKRFSEPDFVDESSALIETLREFEPQQLSELMGISDNLAELNHRRYAEWQPEFGADVARPAALAFKGDVYLGLEGYSLSAHDFNWAQKHLRILSGLHGLLRPLDRIRPYRLEMGTRLSTDAGSNLYDFWGDKITCALNQALRDQKSAAEKRPLLINLASNEYWHVVRTEQVEARIISVNFRELRNGEYKFLSFFAKKARGTMVRYMIDQRVKTLKALQAFDYDGYSFNKELSQGDNWVFTRSPQN
ncbi:MAG: peroxide stress protein YaaA [Pseudomonadota bacterium]